MFKIGKGIRALVVSRHEAPSAPHPVGTRGTLVVPLVPTTLGRCVEHKYTHKTATPSTIFKFIMSKVKCIIGKGCKNKNGCPGLQLAPNDLGVVAETLPHKNLSKDGDNPIELELNTP